MSEKIEPGDGRASSPKVIEAAEAASRRFVVFDMERIAIENGSACALPEMLTWLRAMPGCSISTASAVIPPMELPTTQASCAMPSARTTSIAARAPSSIDSSGKSRR